MPHFASRSGAVALTSAALMGLSGLALPAVATAADATCAPEDATYSVTGGTVEWGVKQTFRSYIKSPVASGDWTPSEGVTFAGVERGEDGRFIWPIADGSIASESAATANTEGDVRFTGHHGSLDLTLSNPTVDVDGTTGSLMLDYRSKVNGTDDQWLEGSQAVAATFDLDAALDFHNEGSVTVSTGETALEETFVDAMADFYAAGAPMDPITATITVTSSCEDAGEPGDGGDDNGDGGNGGDNGGGDDNGTLPGDDDDNTGGGFFGSLGSLGKLFDFLPF